MKPFFKKTAIVSFLTAFFINYMGVAHAGKISINSSMFDLNPNPSSSFSSATLPISGYNQNADFSSELTPAFISGQGITIEPGKLLLDFSLNPNPVTPSTKTSYVNVYGHVFIDYSAVAGLIGPHSMLPMTSNKFVSLKTPNNLNIGIEEDAIFNYSFSIFEITQQAMDIHHSGNVLIYSNTPSNMDITAAGNIYVGDFSSLIAAPVPSSLASFSLGVFLIAIVRTRSSFLT